MVSCVCKRKRHQSIVRSDILCTCHLWLHQLVYSRYQYRSLSTSPIFIRTFITHIDVQSFWMIYLELKLIRAFVVVCIWIWCHATHSLSFHIVALAFIAYYRERRCSRCHRHRCKLIWKRHVMSLHTCIGCNDCNALDTIVHDSCVLRTETTAALGLE